MSRSDSIIRIAVIADVHANLPALEAVIAHARKQGADQIWDAGDNLGYGASPGACLDLIRKECKRSILGNYDDKVRRFPQRKKDWRRRKHPLKYEAFRYAHHQLKDKHLSWLAGLPRQFEKKFGIIRLVMRHEVASWRGELLATQGRSDLMGRLEEEFAGCGPTLLLGGHVHHPCQGRSAVIPLTIHMVGSAGRPIDGDPRAHYSLVKIDGKDFDIENFRVEYDLRKAARAIRKAGQPEAFAVMLERGIDLPRAEYILGD